MPERHEHRPGAGPAAQRGADHLVADRPAASRRRAAARLVEAAGQARLGDADARHVQQPAEMAGEAEAARMREALAVAEQQLRAGVPAPPARRAPPGSRETTAGPARRGRRSARRATALARPARDRRGAAPRPPPSSARRPARSRRRCRRPASIGPNRSASSTRPASSACSARASAGRQVPGMLGATGFSGTRRARASSMMRTVSDHRPSCSISSSVNQRASAASPPGRSVGARAPRR